ncbi:hypothetical protein HF670_07425 [Acidithiobacillus thiooxidans]|uniref:toprim domain-containing protein n=1 Tax=Acidithiobacillus thiooxidans TaxID=930 RepID=UPI001C06DBF8|nr:toprim domain-containing protein [Acidithiobacillus thiooxidans]MBU2839395.1 hypothetical protein [Acidithiobacillus thiooxidans]
MSDPIHQFRNALADAGVILAPHSQIIADGALHRVPLANDRPGQQTGWYRLHFDSPIAGAGGDWRQGLSIRWTMQRQSALSAKDREVLQQRIKREQTERQAELEAQHKEAAKRALWVWDQAEPADPDHEYLRRKQIRPGIARQRGDLLILPIIGFDGDLRGIQTIAEDGSKRFTRGMAKMGAFIRVAAMPAPDRQMIVCEGWATASSVAELSPGACVIAALDAGNLMHVGTEARKRFPRIDLVIAADADPVGMEKAKAAAIAASAKWVWPKFPKDAPAGLSDFNDWVCWRRNQRAEGSHV